MSLPITPVSKNKDLTVINLFGGPGSGKSTTAAGLFHLMKLKSFDVELVTEFPKDLVYQQRFNMFFEQDYIFAEQHHRQRRLVQYGVTYCVTDSPLLLSNFYADENYYSGFLEFTNNVFNSFNNINILVRRIKKYIAKGRNQTPEEARAIDLKTIELFFNKGMNFFVVKGNHRAPDMIMTVLQQETDICDYDVDEMCFVDVSETNKNSFLNWYEKLQKTIGY